MASRTCGYCGYAVHLTLRWFTTDPIGPVNMIRGAYTCDRCQQINAAWLTANANPSGPIAADGLLSAERVSWAPTYLAGQDIPDVPDQIASAASEAYLCQSAGANRGAILLARTAIEATAKAKDIKTGGLLAKIDALAEQGFIRPLIAQGAHQVRLIGNDMAHGDLNAPIDENDVAATLQLMTIVLNEVFQTPALIAQITAKRSGD
jgi:hypothetical protein